MSMQAQSLGGVTAPIHSQPDARKRWIISATFRQLYPRERPGFHCTLGWVGLEALLDGSENLAKDGIRSPDRPASSKSLYRLA